METLFNIHHNPIPNQLHHHQSNSNSSSIHYFSHQSNSNSSTTIPKPCTKVPSKTTTFTTQKTSIPTFINTSQLKQPPSKPPSQSYQKAPTGYAVALLDAAQCHINVLDAVERDVTRLSKWLRNEQLQGVMTNPCLEMKDKGDIVKETVKKGKFHNHLLKLVNILVENTKVELLSQVLMEFGRIYDELIGSSNDQLVLLSSSVKMKENQVLKIAKRVQNLTGANKVIVRTKYCYMMNN